MTLPSDPIILLSYVNTQLRDTYPSLDELCAALCVEKYELVEKLDAIGYYYDSGTNRFIPAV